jgi:enoyl-[acyl-carrier protein] reductase III
MKSYNSGKTILITGGTRGIGKSAALYLAKESVSTFFINYLENDEAAMAIQTELESMGARVFLLKNNMAFTEEIMAMFKVIKEQTGQLDFFVHCPAVTAFKPLCKVKPNQWDLTMNVNARSFLQCTQGCIPLMQNGGQIVAVSSTGSRRYTPNYGALGVTKSTLEAVVRYLAVELAERNIRVNGVTAGLIKGKSVPPFPDLESIMEETLKRTPAGRLGTPDDVAEVIHFLLTRATWMYGQNILIDGGYCLT